MIFLIIYRRFTKTEIEKGIEVVGLHTLGVPKHAKRRADFEKTVDHTVNH